MPKQKDLKRLVRSRMKKTGEAYTAARLQVLKKSEPAPSNYADVAGMSDASVSKRTGRTWAQWVGVLDRAWAAEKPHREIAEYVSSLGTPDWLWSAETPSDGALEFAVRSTRTGRAAFSRFHDTD